MHESLTSKGSLLFLLPNNTKISSQTTLATTSQFLFFFKEKELILLHTKTKSEYSQNTVTIAEAFTVPR